MTVTLLKSQLPAAIGSSDIPYPACNLHAGDAPMVYTAGSSSTWFSVSPPAGNLQPGGNTGVGITSIDYESLLDADNTGFVIVTASGYKQLTGLEFGIDCSQTGPNGPICRYSYSCP